MPGTHKITLRQDGFYTFQQDFYWDDNGQDQYILLPALTPITQEEAEEETPETPTEDIYSQPEIPAE